jgi:hypothetical protein
MQLRGEWKVGREDDRPDDATTLSSRVHISDLQYVLRYCCVRVDAQRFEVLSILSSRVTQTYTIALIHSPAFSLLNLKSERIDNGV